MEKRNRKNYGFVLSSRCYDRKGHIQIELWVATVNGPTQLIIQNEKAIFFVEKSSISLVSQLLKTARIAFIARELALKTFSLQSLVGLYFDNLRSFYDAIKLLDESAVNIFESHVRVVDRLLMERFIYGSLEFIGKLILRQGFEEIQDARLKSAHFTPKLTILSLDIECSANEELFCIGLYSCVDHSEFEQVIMIGKQKPAEKTQQFVRWVSDETELLLEFEKSIQQFDPDIIIGWNVINFDFRVIVERAAVNGISLKLGRNSAAIRWRENRTEKNQGFIDVEGRVVIDGIAALKAESYSFPSFSLEAIAQHFLGKGKATENHRNRLDEIVFNFQHNKPQLAHYNLQDCKLVWEIFDKAQLMSFLIFRSQLTGLELDRAGGSVAAFNNLYLPKLHRQGYVSPNLPESGGLMSPGGYVMDSKPGLYKQVLVLDFKSLYPSIIRTFKIDPMGLIESQFDSDNAIPGFLGAEFSRTKHLLPQIITDLWAQRDQAKKDSDQARSIAIKILMNSFYGVLGSGGCPFYNAKLASSITMRGHSIMQQTADWIEQQGYSVIYGDTDSTFVLLGETVSDDQANEIGNRLAEKINRQWKEKLLAEFSLECFLEIEFESHFTRFLMPTIRGSETGSKKRYAGLVRKGKSEVPVFKGLESVRTDWTMLARNFQRELYQLVFSDQDPTALIENLVSDTLNGLKDDQLIYSKRLRRPLSSYQKNIPPHVRAARNADLENLKLGKPMQYQYKGSISYLMTVNGPQAIEYVTSKIDYQHYVDKQIHPVADGILAFVGLNFTEIVEPQLGLF